MLFGAVSVIVIVTGLGGADGAAAIENAVRGALGPDAVVSVQPQTVVEDDATLRARATEAHATLVGVVRQSDEQHATIRFARPNEGWSEREIRFDPSDAPRERGRTIGFAIASAVPDEAPAPVAPPPPPPPPVAAPIAPPPPARRAPDADHASTGYPSSRAPWVDAIGMVGTGIDGFGGGAGGAIAGRFLLRGNVRARFALGIRGSDVPPAQASARAYLAGAGLAWQTWVDSERRYGLGARVDGLAIGTEVSHFDADDASPARKFRVVPGAGAALEGTLRFTPSAAFIAAVGAEVAFGTTDLYLHDELVAKLVPFRAMSEVGLRIFF